MFAQFASLQYSVREARAQTYCATFFRGFPLSAFGLASSCSWWRFLCFARCASISPACLGYPIRRAVCLSIPVLLAALVSAGASGTDGWPAPENAGTLPATCRHADLSPGEPVVPYPLAKIPLEDVTYWAKADLQPDTSLCFAPDCRRLVLGTFLGRVMVVDVYSGRHLWEKQVAEGMVKQVAFSADGARVFFGEQSVDAFLYAADAQSGKTLWRFRLADDLKPGRPVGSESRYAVYQLPGCYRIVPLDNGDVVVLGLHSWGSHARVETMTRLARVYRFSPEGKLRWAFPANGPAPLTIIHLAADRHGRRVAVLTGATAGNTPAHCPWRPGSLYVLDGATGKQIGGHTFEPLKPYFEQVGFWHSVSVDPAGRRAAVGTFDGRTFLFDLDTVSPLHAFRFGVPFLVSGVPVSARTTYVHLAADGMAYFQTGNSSVPFASRTQHVVSPPGPHPWANTIHAVGPDGKVRWRYRSGHEYQGFWTSSDGRWLATCVVRDRNGIRDAGAMLFDTHRPGGGSAKFLYYYQVEGLTFFHAAMAPDGSAFAFVEVPYQNPKTDMLVGTYQVHVIR